jgi:hypothetical protein
LHYGKFPIFGLMYKTKHTPTRQLVALLLMAVMVFVHVVKVLHTHSRQDIASFCKQENTITQAHAAESVCSICEFQLAKDVPFIGQPFLVIAPVHFSPTYSRLLTAIHPDRFFIVDSRGPPSVCG